DATSATGYRVAIASVAQLKDAHNHPVDPSIVWQSDGFSRVSMIVATLAVPVMHDGLVGIRGDYSTTTNAESHTLLVEANAGTLTPHYADVDWRTSKPTRQGIILYPAVLVKPKTRYVVALQGIVGPDGQVAPAPAGFRKLRDKNVGDDTALAGI